ncbi:hypothetical protein NQ317_016484 [Molorchus minor]|uniref:Uncharacterized protein n=1 Tax=Molorchus minor TaxID=1323400 RepID=A0ABQ9JF89_9CUCU|nr:hypothetical protein NQ317_016484 [Molorchus minor]
METEKNLFFRANREFLIVVLSILAVSQAASVVPIDSSSVSVKHSGKDYAYTIQENHGIAIGPSPLIHQVPIVKTAAPSSEGVLHNQVDQKVGGQQDDEQIHGQGQERVQVIASGTIQGQLRPQEQLKAINYLPPTIGGYQLLPYNIPYPLTYPYGIHYPYNVIRIA